MLTSFLWTNCFRYEPEYDKTNASSSSSSSFILNQTYSWRKGIIYGWDIIDWRHIEITHCSHLTTNRTNKNNKNFWSFEFFPTNQYVQLYPSVHICCCVNVFCLFASTKCFHISVLGTNTFHILFIESITQHHSGLTCLWQTDG